MNDAGVTLEAYVRRTFEVDEAGLRRIALFLLAHVLVDTRLIALALFKKVGERAGSSLAAVQALSDKVSERTFLQHLKRVRAHLSDDNAATAEALNAARDALLHWKRDRHPLYKGHDVTSDAGFQACAADVLRFLQTVPFQTPSTGGAGELDG